MKVFIHDHGWSGSDIVFAKSREDAIAILSDRYLPYYQKSSDDHVKHWSVSEPDRHNPWIRYVDSIRSGSFFTGLQEHEIVEGLVLETVGDI